jgi:ubiquinone/menaquinone biosynthesis C-methylase UbiE
MIAADGWRTYNIWDHSTAVRELYARRCRREEPEMTCAAQAAELLAPHVQARDTLLDAGCGSGYFYHSLRDRGIPAEYYGIDATVNLIEIGRRWLPQHGLPAERLRAARIEDLRGEVDHVVCMNVLSNLDNYHRPLERLLRMCRKSLVLRESASERTEYKYVVDEHLDAGCDLCVHVNTYCSRELMEFIANRGFDVTMIADRRTAGHPEIVIGHPHHWTFFHAWRRGSR